VELRSDQNQIVGCATNDDSVSNSCVICACEADARFSRSGDPELATPPSSAKSGADAAAGMMNSPPLASRAKSKSESAKRPVNYAKLCVRMFNQALSGLNLKLRARFAGMGVAPAVQRSRPVPLKSITKSIASERDIAAARSPAKGFVRPWRAHNMEVTPIANQ
jgi:hypothetical protein